MEQNPEKKTTVALTPDTREQLAKFGKKGESFDTIIQRVMSGANKFCNKQSKEKEDVVEEEV